MSEKADHLLKQLRSLTNQLKESESKLRIAANGAPVVLFVIDQDGIFTLSEGKGLEALGLKPGEVVGRSVFDVYKNNKDIKRSIRLALKGADIQKTIIEKNTVWLTQFTPYQGGVIGIATNITTRHKLEKELEETACRLTGILEAAVDGIVTIDVDGNIAYPLNPAGAKMFGYTVDELVGQHVTVLMPKRYHEIHDDAITKYLETGIRRIIGTTRIVEAIHRDGTEFPIELSVSESIVGSRLLFTAFIRKK